MRTYRRDRFIKTNNVASSERLPDGTLADVVNLDITASETAELRTGFVVVESDAEDVFPMGDSLAVLKQGYLYERRPDGTMTMLAPITGREVSAAWLNGELFVSTVYERLRIRDGVVRDWSEKAPAYAVELVDGVLKPGIYQVAVTAYVDGVESGCYQTPIEVPEGKTIRVTHNDSRMCRLWCSVANGETLYSQGVAFVQNTILSPFDNSERLEVSGMVDMPYCDQLIAHESMIVGSNGKTLFHSEPMYPHLTVPETHWFQFSAPITVIASIAAGVIVCADKTYLLTGIGTADPALRTVAAFGGVKGTVAALPNESVCWFTEYGQAVASPDGSVSLPHKQEYSPDIAPSGAAGYFEHNGNPIVLTTMRGPATQSGMRSLDHWELEKVDD